MIWVLDKASDINFAEALLETCLILRKTGHFRHHPKRVVADKGYTDKVFRKYLSGRNIRYKFSHRINVSTSQRHFQQKNYRKRNVVEHPIKRLKQFRRIATRYEKRVANFSAMIRLLLFFYFPIFRFCTQTLVKLHEQVTD